MRLSFLLGFVLFTISSLAQANVNAEMRKPEVQAISLDPWNQNWVGDVEFNMNEGEEVRACHADLRMSSSEEEFGFRVILTEGCGWDMSLLFERQGNKLFYEGQSAGTISDNRISLGPIIVGDFGFEYRLNLILSEDNQLFMRESTIFSREVKDTVVGTLNIRKEE